LKTDVLIETRKHCAVLHNACLLISSTHSVNMEFES